MDALILSGSTGGGHNGAAYALQEELRRRGHGAVVMDPYALVSEDLARAVGNAYIRLVQKAPRLFGLLYQLGACYRRLPLHSPVYAVNRRMVKPMWRYLDGHSFDVILALHVFPGEILACGKAAGRDLPTTVTVATDYTCIPFLEETGSDYYVIPSPRLVQEFVCRGIAAARIRPFGIPVRSEFLGGGERETLLAQLKLDPKKRYLLLMGGSMGAGKIPGMAAHLQTYLRVHTDHVLIVVCGSNQKLYAKLSARYREQEQVILLHTTDHLWDYLHVSDVLITKPGGLTSTEAAVSGIPLIHMAPIPGCETRNLRFFSEHGLSVNLPKAKGGIASVLEKLCEPVNAETMRRLQRAEINPHAARDICDFAEQAARGAA